MTLIARINSEGALPKCFIRVIRAIRGLKFVAGRGDPLWIVVEGWGFGFGWGLGNIVDGVFT
jgi:hypothetical protein